MRMNRSDLDTAALRKEYGKERLVRCEMPLDPLVRAKEWIEEAIALQIDDAAAMILATASADGRPSTRTVLMKGIEDGRFLFYTNYESRKGRQLADNPYVSLSFVWHRLERQIHLEGKAEKITAEASDRYFDSRPEESRIGAIVSPQSRIIPNRMSLIRDYLKEKRSGRPAKRPAHWGGYAVTPERIEFWQGREYRLHDRILYTRRPDGRWDCVRLAP